MIRGFRKIGRVHEPSIHAATTSLLAFNAVVTLAVHHISAELEAVLFCVGGVFAALSADIEREWNKRFGHHD